ncbi:MAG: transporter substrate-binding domain-containing protein [Deltaproteobacteria bacterium]|nr:transporter substrate-binding domain-containing protein [Myxococcales bacterium]MDP3212837.1 transporter substrate-binding domain-containing protein [Deltaproteobacteria bacterium]
MTEPGLHHRRSARARCGPFGALTLALVLLPPQRAWAQRDASAPEVTARAPVLRVGVAGAAPFVLPPGPGGVEPRGLSIEVWREVAARNHWAYEYRSAESTEHLLAMVAAGEVDVGVGPTSITAERVRRVAFSQPYQDASLAILARSERRYTDRIRPFLSRAFALGIGSLLLVLLIVGALVWLAERRRNGQQFPEAPVPGIANGVWLALVTMTTVGYGDRAPITPLGRAIMGVWMVAALVTSSSLTASLTTALTLSQLDPAAVLTSSELRGRRVGAVAGTTSIRFVVRHGGTDVAYRSLDAAVRGLLRRDVSAVVFDRPALRHYLQEHPEQQLQLSEASYEPQGYGFSMRHGSALWLPIDVALLSLRQDGSVAALAARWLGE